MSLIPHELYGGDKLMCNGLKCHRTKIQVSVSVKRDGNLQILIYVAFPCCGNTKISFLGHMLRFR